MKNSMKLLLALLALGGVVNVFASDAGTGSPVPAAPASVVGSDSDAGSDATIDMDRLREILGEADDRDTRYVPSWEEEARAAESLSTLQRGLRVKRACKAKEALAAEETEEAREARQARNPSLYPRTVWERDGGYWGAAKRNPGRVSGALIAALLLAGLAGEAGYNGEDSVVRKYAGKAYSKAQDSMAWVREYLASLMAKEGAK